MIEESSQNSTGATAVAEDRQQQNQAPWEQQQWRPESESEQGNSAGKKKQQSTLQNIRQFRVEFGPSTKDILNFTNQLAVMIRAGISLQDSLESIAEQTDNQQHLPHRRNRR